MTIIMVGLVSVTIHGTFLIAQRKFSLARLVLSVGSPPGYKEDTRGVLHNDKEMVMRFLTKVT